VANLIADFFQEKANRLSNNYGPDDYRIGNSDIQFTVEKIIKAANMLKPKLCAGED